MNQKPQDLNDLFAEHEAEALTRTRAEMAAEQAAWDALPQEERDRITAERDAKLARFAEIVESADDEDETVGDDEEEGQDRESYSDTQDRENYSSEEEEE